MIRTMMAAAVMLGSAAPATAARNLIVNGDFETAGSTSKAAAGWTYTVGREPTYSVPGGDADMVARYSGNDYARLGASGTSAQLNNHFMVFGSNYSNAGFSYAQQTFNTKLGAVYTVSYDLAYFGRYLYPVFSGTAITYQHNDGRIVYAFLEYAERSATGYDLGSIYIPKSYTFFGTGTDVTLSLMSQVNRSPMNAFFDNVVVTELGAAAVPEPATWAMMIAGFGLVGGALRRRARPAHA